MGHRYNLRAILVDPAQRRALLVDVIIATQAREGIATTREQAEQAYDNVQREKLGRPSEPARILKEKP